MTLTKTEEMDLQDARSQLNRGAYNAFDGHKKRLEKKIKFLEEKEKQNGKNDR